jgi:hypothetical protein
MLDILWLVCQVELAGLDFRLGLRLEEAWPIRIGLATICSCKKSHGYLYNMGTAHECKVRQILADL